MPGTLHIHPLDDLVDHGTATDDADCVCGPTIRPAEQDDGSVGWLIVHNSLDGRERRES